ncbi:hypothetical protein BN2127_JRS7_03520 [Bacillus subtilis]|nr:hypothetical protein BN2127_JRS1_09273 [Bacillus cereus]CUB44099.1 hypothetical protein BN2127_JRS7_03520 [Bacillus subtilis]
MCVELPHKMRQIKNGEPKSYCGLTENLNCGALLPFSADENLLIFTLLVELREG